MNEPPAPKLSMIFIAWTFLISILAGDRHAARGQQRGAEDDGADGVLVVRIAGAHVVIGQRAEVVLLHQPVQRDRGARGALQFRRRTIGLHVERLAELRHARADFGVASPRARSAASSSTSTISMWPPKLAHCWVRSE